jgi:hypothetical protein
MIETYSRDYQDVFVDNIINKKNNGFYVEIGSGDPISGNNTYLLEKNNKWEGVSIDIDLACCKKFNSVRKNSAFCLDALKVDFLIFFKEQNVPNNIDYLQIDCEPALTTFNVLKKIPLKEYKFSVITFEHDFYNSKLDAENFFVREKSRKYLASYGYVMIADDLSCKGKYEKPFEDWWIYPESISAEMIKKFICVNGASKEVGDYVLKRL